jgi:CheY-like chemotaxis protein
LLSIINDILDFSKIESGKFELDPIDFEPRKEFTNIADLFRARCSEKNILFTLWLDPQLPRGSSGLNGDILRIKQVISNLLSNAIKFTEPQKAIELRIAYDPVQQQLTCHVIDEGLGISLENQQRVFEAFSQAESSTTRKFGGTGLGLSISSKLINLLGGQLQLVSELGKGSDFYFSLPAKTIELAHISVPANVQATDALAFTGHILLVEDNKTNQLLMSAILKRQGLSFDIANDGLEALDCLQTDHDYALVLMDENMPNLNGIEATKQIRAYEHLHNLPAVPIIALTANAMTGDRERFITVGMNEYLTKPINIPALVDVFKQFLKTH